MQENTPKKSRQMPRLSRILYDEDGRYGIGGISVLIILLLIAVFILVSIFTDLGIWLTLLVTFAIYTIIIVGIALIAVCTSIFMHGQ